MVVFLNLRGSSYNRQFVIRIDFDYEAVFLIAMPVPDSWQHRKRFKAGTDYLFDLLSIEVFGIDSVHGVVCASIQSGIA